MLHILEVGAMQTNAIFLPFVSEAETRQKLLRTVKKEVGSLFLSLQKQFHLETEASQIQTDRVYAFCNELRRYETDGSRGC